MRRITEVKPKGGDGAAKAVPNLKRRVHDEPFKLKLFSKSDRRGKRSLHRDHSEEDQGGVGEVAQTINGTGATNPSKKRRHTHIPRLRIRSRRDELGFRGSNNGSTGLQEGSTAAGVAYLGNPKAG